MRLFLLAYKEAMNQKLRDVDWFRPRGRASLYDLSGEKRNTCHDWVSAHRESANGARFPFLRLNKVIKHATGEAHSFCVQSSGTAINVVVAGPARGKLEFSEPKRFAREHVQQKFA